MKYQVQFKCWSNFIFAKIWVQHDQGGGDRTCLPARCQVLPCSPGPRGRRQIRRRSNLRANVETLLTRSNKQALNIWKSTWIYVNLVWLRRS